MAKRKGKPKSTAVNNVPVNATETADLDVKVCRLCETKEGPFLNIFDGEKNTAKKIDELMPFGVTENDDLPHKICFRCSAKVEELYEFVQKCIKAQENLCKYSGKKYPALKMKTHRSIWEEKLNQSNFTNDDICDAVIKKAMEGLKHIPLILLTDDCKLPDSKVTDLKSIPKVSKSPELPTSNVKNIDEITDIKKMHEIPSKRSLRSANDGKLREDTSTQHEFTQKTQAKPKNPVKTRTSKHTESLIINKNDNLTNTSIDKGKTIQLVKDTDTPVLLQNKVEQKDEAKIFNIMDHVSMIKVNGVGVLFQCKLCNRNFLKKEVVLSHLCAKSGVAKDSCIKKAAPPEVPKVPTVKYINTKITDAKKQQGLDSASSQRKSDNEYKKIISEGGGGIDAKNTINKPKPRIGPASKVKQISNNDSNTVATSTIQRPESLSGKSTSDILWNVAPSLNCRYKLVPGPNNTFNLIETPTGQKEETVLKDDESRKRKLSVEKVPPVVISKQRKVLRSETLDKSSTVKNLNSDADNAVGLKDNTHKETVNQPYPVGLFKTVSHHSKSKVPPAPAIIPFATSTKKKQSYTIVQTGNPSKLLISAKPQPQSEQPSKKKQKIVKPSVEGTQDQSFSVLEHTSHPDKDAGFFTFINVDPLLQPSYVLPTHSTIQESEISTSSPDTQKSDKSKQYTCNLCNETFTREQKLLVHIHSHYNKMDEDDQKRGEKFSRKRAKKA